MPSRATLACFVCCTLSLAASSFAKDQNQQISDRIVKQIVATPFAKLPFDESVFQKTIEITKGSALDGALGNCLKRHQALIIHFAVWSNDKTDGPYDLQTSNWYVYHAKLKRGICELEQAALKADDQPLLYGDSEDAILWGFHSFSSNANVSIIYKVSTTPKKPDNVQNLGMLFSALAGISAAGGGALEAGPRGYVAIGTIPAYKTLPFEFNVAFTLSPSDNKETAPDTKTAPGGPAKGSVSLDDGKVNDDYQRRIAEPGKSYRIADGGGKLPVGLKLSADGTISGKPERAGEYKFTLEIADGSETPQTRTVEYFLRILPEQDSAAGGIGGAKPPKPSKSNPAPKAKADKSQASPSGDNATTQDASSDATAVDCTAASKDSPCALNRSFKSDDREWWDVGIALSIPGVKEAQFSLDTNNVIQRKVTTHTNLYAVADLYPFSYWKSKEDSWLHLSAGLPVTGQTFYRPYFGAAENLTRLTRIDRLGFPVRVDFFAGIVYAKEVRLTQFKVGDTVTPAAFNSAMKSTRAIKPIFGIELPVSALISKIGKK